MEDEQVRVRVSDRAGEVKSGVPRECSCGREPRGAGRIEHRLRSSREHVGSAPRDRAGDELEQRALHADLHLEPYRRRFLKREDDDESTGSGFVPGSPLSGWPGSWTARVP